MPPSLGDKQESVHYSKHATIVNFKVFFVDINQQRADRESVTPNRLLNLQPHATGGGK